MELIDLGARDLGASDLGRSTGGNGPGSERSGIDKPGSFRPEIHGYAGSISDKLAISLGARDLRTVSRFAFLSHSTQLFVILPAMGLLRGVAMLLKSIINALNR